MMNNHLYDLSYKWASYLNKKTFIFDYRNYKSVINFGRSRSFWAKLTLMGSLSSIFLVGIGQASALAQVAHGAVGVRLEIQRGCLFVVDPRANGAAESADPSLLHLECNPGTAYQFEVDAGANGDAGDVRRLVLTGEQPGRDRSATISYGLFTDAGSRHALAANVPFAGLAPIGGRATLPLYARIEPQADAPASGAYSDTLQVTLTW